MKLFTGWARARIGPGVRSERLSIYSHIGDDSQSMAFKGGFQHIDS